MPENIIALNLAIIYFVFFYIMNIILIIITITLIISITIMITMIISFVNIIIVLLIARSRENDDLMIKDNLMINLNTWFPNHLNKKK